MMCRGRVIGRERPTRIRGALLGGGSGGGRIRKEEKGGMGVQAMANSLRCSIRCGMRMGVRETLGS